jgi:esterase/lipase superfamily enzyme
VIFLAPDIDVDIFRETTMQYIHSLSTYTVYGSSNDQALRVSKLIHDHKREGERPDRYTIDYPADHKPPGRWFESVDASSTDTSLIGHFYYDGSVAQVTLDLAGVLNDREKERPSVWNAGGTFREFSTTQK